MADMIFMPYSPKITIANWRQDLYLSRLKSKVPTIIYYLQLGGEDLQLGRLIFLSQRMLGVQRSNSTSMWRI
jgi:hypothetical protein